MSLVVKCFPRGSLVRLTASFTDMDGLAVDPASVSVSTLDPDLDIVSKSYPVDAEVIKDDVGEYHYDADASKSGAWSFRWEGTGAGQAAAEGKFTVNSSAFPQGSP
jgi:hypothetical protein